MVSQQVWIANGNKGIWSFGGRVAEHGKIPFQFAAGFPR